MRDSLALDARSRDAFDEGALQRQKAEFSPSAASLAERRQLPYIQINKRFGIQDTQAIAIRSRRIKAAGNAAAFVGDHFNYRAIQQHT